MVICTSCFDYYLKRSYYGIDFYPCRQEVNVNCRLCGEKLCGSLFYMESFTLSQIPNSQSESIIWMINKKEEESIIVVNIYSMISSFKMFESNDSEIIEMVKDCFHSISDEHEVTIEKKGDGVILMIHYDIGVSDDISTKDDIKKFSDRKSEESELYLRIYESISRLENLRNFHISNRHLLTINDNSIHIISDNDNDQFTINIFLYFGGNRVKKSKNIFHLFGKHLYVNYESMKQKMEECDLSILTIDKFDSVEGEDRYIMIAFKPSDIMEVEKFSDMIFSMFHDQIIINYDLGDQHPNGKYFSVYFDVMDDIEFITIT